MNFTVGSRSWNENSLSTFLNALSWAKKDTYWITSDLQFVKSSCFSRLCWKMCKHFDFLRRFFYGIDHKQSNKILSELAPQVRNSENKALINLFNRAVSNYNSIASNKAPSAFKNPLTLLVNGRHFIADKDLLIEKSDFFAGMFTGNFLERSGEVAMEEIDENTMEQFLLLASGEKVECYEPELLVQFLDRLQFKDEQLTANFAEGAGLAEKREDGTYHLKEPALLYLMKNLVSSVDLRGMTDQKMIGLLPNLQEIYLPINTKISYFDLAALPKLEVIYFDLKGILKFAEIKDALQDPSVLPPRVGVHLLGIRDFDYVGVSSSSGQEKINSHFANRLLSLTITFSYSSWINTPRIKHARLDFCILPNSSLSFTLSKDLSSMQLKNCSLKKTVFIDEYTLPENLKKVEIEDCKFVEATKLLQGCKQLEVLCIKNSELSWYHCILPSLTMLDIENCQLSYLDRLRSCTALTTLRIKNCDLKSLKEMPIPPSVRILDLTDSELSENCFVSLLLSQVGVDELKLSCRNLSRAKSADFRENFEHWPFRSLTVNGKIVKNLDDLFALFY